MMLACLFALQTTSPNIRIGNFLVGAPCGIAFVYRDRAAFVLDTGGPYTAGTAAPDDSYHRQTFELKGAKVTLEWGRVGDAVLGKLSSDRSTDISIALSAGWPDLRSRFRPSADGAVGEAEIGKSHVHWSLNIFPRPVISSDFGFVVPVEPDQPAQFAAGFGVLPEVDTADRILAKARDAYEARRPKASGLWGDFVGAIADNMNNSRIYSTDNHRLAHSVSRRWAGGPNSDPYFCWDSFFTALLASIDDPATAKDTVRAILSRQTKEGLVPNFGHWNFGSARDSVDRSQPPVGSLCVWRMHERRPDLDFLREVYPKLLRWHDWWPKYRDGNHNGLLEWGSATGDWQNAQYETGWDDNLHFAGTHMVGPHMDADAVDLTSMWSMDADYLARIADAVGKPEDARRLRTEHLATNRRIDAMLWNPRLGIYCSRYWHPERLVPVPFKDGFRTDFFGDEDLKSPIAQTTLHALDFDWAGKSAYPGVPANHWSARFSTTVNLAANGRYRIETRSDDGIRVYVDGRRVIDLWTVHAPVEKSIDLPLGQGKPISLKIEYFQHEGGSSLQFSLFRVEAARPEDAFLTRVTPMNFYPLLAGVPKGDHAAKTMAWLTDPKRFWGRYLIPTLPYGDPSYPQQQYWRGDVWGPVNYLLWQGIRAYASVDVQRQYAERSVRLFMSNWIADGICSENYYSNTGKPGGDPHYTWGALLSLIGFEFAQDHPVPGVQFINLPIARHVP